MYIHINVQVPLTHRVISNVFIHSSHVMIMCFITIKISFEANTSCLWPINRPHMTLVRTLNVAHIVVPVCNYNIDGRQDIL